MLMGGRKDGGRKRTIQKNGRIEWGERDRYNYLIIATEHRRGGFTV